MTDSANMSGLSPELAGGVWQRASIAPQRHDPVLENFRALSGRIGIFGGSFDPVHNGHLAIARAAMVKHGLDCVVFVPTPHNPLKAWMPHASDADRFSMLALALAREPGFYVSPIELNQSGRVYSVDTLREVAVQVRPKSALFFIAGVDVIPSLPNWKAPHELLSLVTFVSVARAGFSEADIAQLVEKLSSEEIKQLKESFVSIGQIDISSTAIRKGISEGTLPINDLPPDVVRYIVDKGLYNPQRY